MIYIPYTVRSALSYLICVLSDVLSVWMNLGNIWHSMFVWLCVSSIKTSARRIMLLDEQPSVVRLGRRTHNGRSYVQKKNIYGSLDCGAFYRLKWRNWRAKMCFRPLKETNEKWESNNRTKWAINQNREVITVLALLPFCYNVCERLKDSSYWFVAFLFFRIQLLLFSQGPP